MRFKHVALFAAILIAGFVIVTASANGIEDAAETASTTLTSDFIVEYPLPIADSRPLNIAVESPGKVWFTLANANAIGSLMVNSPTDYTFEIFPLPDPDSEPYDIALRGDYVWFTQRAGNRIGRLAIATGAITQYAVPTADSAPTGIAIAPNGHVWFVQQAGNKVARFNPTSATFFEYTYATSGGDFEDIALSSNARAWITAPGLTRVLFFDEATGDFELIPVQKVFAGQLYPPDSIALDINGNTWISSVAANGIAIYLPGTLALWRWQNTFPENWGPMGMTISASDGLMIIWNTSPGDGRIAQRAFRDYERIYRYDLALPTANSEPAGIAVDAAGHAWIAASGGNQIAEWRPPYVNLINLPFTTR